MEKNYKNKDRSEKLRKMVPISEDEINDLNKLLEGVDSAIELMSTLVQPFDQEIDVSKMSSTVDGENYD
ncbi:MAG: hypothetical protein CL893_04415 [Dehalococcoidia bacterium]|nr:hypothetical protein [Dehalococcoidia bacterium]